MEHFSKIKYALLFFPSYEHLLYFVVGVLFPLILPHERDEQNPLLFRSNIEMQATRPSVRPSVRPA
jgi:hypothetical protein